MISFYIPHVWNCLAFSLYLFSEIPENCDYVIRGLFLLQFCKTNLINVYRDFLFFEKCSRKSGAISKLWQAVKLDVLFWEKQLVVVLLCQRGGEGGNRLNDIYMGYIYISHVYIIFNPPLKSFLTSILLETKKMKIQI